jgi:hypothetical protein
MMYAPEGLMHEPASQPVPQLAAAKCNPLVLLFPIIFTLTEPHACALAASSKPDSRE